MSIQLQEHEQGGESEPAWKFILESQGPQMKRFSFFVVTFFYLWIWENTERFLVYVGEDSPWNILFADD